MTTDPSLIERLRRAVDRRRLVETARRLVAVPSRTGEAGAAADCRVLAGRGVRPLIKPAEDIGQPIANAPGRQLDVARPVVAVPPDLKRINAA